MLKKINFFPDPPTGGGQNPTYYADRRQTTQTSGSHSKDIHKKESKTRDVFQTVFGEYSPDNLFNLKEGEFTNSGTEWAVKEFDMPKAYEAYKKSDDVKNKLAAMRATFNEVYDTQRENIINEILTSKDRQYKRNQIEAEIRKINEKAGKTVFKNDANGIKEFLNDEDVKKGIGKDIEQELIVHAAREATGNDALSFKDIATPDKAKAALNEKVVKQDFFKTLKDNPEYSRSLFQNSGVPKPPMEGSKDYQNFQRNFPSLHKETQQFTAGASYKPIGPDGKPNPEFVRAAKQYIEKRKKGIAQDDSDRSFSEYIKQNFGEGDAGFKKFTQDFNKFESSASKSQLAPTLAQLAYNSAIMGYGQNQVNKANTPTTQPAYPENIQRNLNLQNRIGQEQEQANIGMPGYERQLLENQQNQAYEKGKQDIVNTSSGQSSAIQAGLQNLALGNQLAKTQNSVLANKTREESQKDLDALIAKQMQEDHLRQAFQANKYNVFDLPQYQNQLNAKAALEKSGEINKLNAMKGIAETMTGYLGNKEGQYNPFGYKPIASDSQLRGGINPLGIQPVQNANTVNPNLPITPEVPQMPVVPELSKEIAPLDVPMMYANPNLIKDKQKGDLGAYKFEDGGEVSGNDVNIEGGELEVDSNMNIVKRFNAPQHPKDGVDERGWRKVATGHYIIPSKDANKFIAMSKQERKKYAEGLKTKTSKRAAESLAIMKNGGHISSSFADRVNPKYSLNQIREYFLTV